jgi:protein-S-isoprenylcysteine O-methyltransferase Ste14
MKNSFAVQTKLMDSLIKYFTAFFFVTYFVCVFVWPSVRTYQLTGINPLNFGKSDNAHDFIGRWFKVLIAAMAVTILVNCTSKEVYSFLLPADFLITPYVQSAGILLSIASLIWTVTAQYQMGKSWRIGIDEKHRTELKMTGLFSISRNPIFLGLLITLLGLFLLLPNALTLLYLVAGYLLIQIQIRLEEEFLQKQHGKNYITYKSQVRRLV